MYIIVDNDQKILLSNLDEKYENILSVDIRNKKPVYHKIKKIENQDTFGKKSYEIILKNNDKISVPGDVFLFDEMGRHLSPRNIRKNNKILFYENAIIRYTEIREIKVIDMLKFNRVVCDNPVIISGVLVDCSRKK